MDKYTLQLDKGVAQKSNDYYFSQRKWLFLTRISIYLALFRWHFRFGSNFTFLRPGLEAKYACEAAEAVGANLLFAGNELDGSTWKRLYHETRMNLPEYLIKRYQYHSSFWSDELTCNRAKLGLVGPRAFTEECLD